MSMGRAATVAERSPPPSCIRMMEPRVHGLLVHVGDLLEDAVGDLLRSLARILIPVVGIDLVAEDDVAEVLDTVDRSRLVVGVRLLIDGVGRTEVKRLYA